jgi:S1-C subfamily serine protease
VAVQALFFQFRRSLRHFERPHIAGLHFDDSRALSNPGDPPSVEGVSVAESSVPLAALAHQGTSGLDYVSEVVPNGPVEKADPLNGDLLASAEDGLVASESAEANAIGRPLSVTALRNQALVDGVIDPTELASSNCSPGRAKCAPTTEQRGQIT